jgi:hypothetical protein
VELMVECGQAAVMARWPSNDADVQLEFHSCVRAEERMRTGRGVIHRWPDRITFAVNKHMPLYLGALLKVSEPASSA